MIFWRRSRCHCSDVYEEAKLLGGREGEVSFCKCFSWVPYILPMRAVGLRESIVAYFLMVLAVIVTLMIMVMVAGLMRSFRHYDKS